MVINRRTEAEPPIPSQQTDKRSNPPRQQIKSHSSRHNDHTEDNSEQAAAQGLWLAHKKNGHSKWVEYALDRMSELKLKTALAILVTSQNLKDQTYPGLTNRKLGDFK